MERVKAFCFTSGCLDTSALWMGAVTTARSFEATALNPRSSPPSSSSCRYERMRGRRRRTTKDRKGEKEGEGKRRRKGGRKRGRKRGREKGEGEREGEEGGREGERRGRETCSFYAL